MVAAISKPFSSQVVSSTPSPVPCASTPPSPPSQSATPRDIELRIASLYARLRRTLLRDAARILPRARDEAEDAVQDALVAVLAAGIASEEALVAATRRSALIRARNGRQRATTKYAIMLGAKALDIVDQEANDASFDDVDDA